MNTKWNVPCGCNVIIKNVDNNLELTNIIGTCLEHDSVEISNLLQTLQQWCVDNSSFVEEPPLGE